jgi:hypothetical protein
MSLLTITFYPSFCAELIVATAGSIFGFGGAYWIYWRAQIQIRKDRLKYFGSLLTSVTTTAKQQAENCNQHAAHLKAQPFTADQMKLAATRDPKRLADGVDQEGVYHAYLWKFGRSNESYKAFQELYSLIDYVAGIIDDMIKTNERITATTWERKKDFANDFRKASDLMRSFQADDELMALQPNLVEQAHQFLQAFGNKERTGENLQEAQNTVVQPMLDYLYNNGQRHPRVTELLFLLQHVSDQYEGIVLQAKHNADDYVCYGKQLNEAEGRLTGLADRLILVFKAL